MPLTRITKVHFDKHKCWSKDQRHTRHYLTRTNIQTSSWNKCNCSMSTQQADPAIFYFHLFEFNSLSGSINILACLNLYYKLFCVRDGIRETSFVWYLVAHFSNSFARLMSTETSTRIKLNFWKNIWAMFMHKMPFKVILCDPGCKKIVVEYFHLATTCY